MNRYFMHGRFLAMTKDPFGIPILGADQGWLVVEKPCGMSVQEGREMISVLSLRSRIETDPKLRDRVDGDPGSGFILCTVSTGKRAGLSSWPASRRFFVTSPSSSNAARPGSAMWHSSTENFPSNRAGVSGPGPCQKRQEAASIPRRCRRDDPLRDPVQNPPTKRSLHPC